MSAVFADTTFSVALVNRRDALHARARSWATTERRSVVTTEFVLLEVANFFKREKDRRRFAALVRTLRVDPNTSVLPLDSSWFDRGLELFANRTDKQWSLTDCISFVVMEDRSLAEALTADQHFAQAGFTILLA